MKGVLASVHRRWPYAPVAVMYVMTLALVANLAFGAAFLTHGAFVRPPQTAMYGTGLTTAAPVDVQQISKAISEANGGPPTIGQPLPAPVIPLALQTAPSKATTPVTHLPPASVTHLPRAALKPIAAAGPRPKMSTLSIATLLALFQAYLASHPQAAQQAQHHKDS